MNPSCITPPRRHQRRRAVVPHGPGFAGLLPAVYAGGPQDGTAGQVPAGGDGSPPPEVLFPALFPAVLHPAHPTRDLRRDLAVISEVYSLTTYTGGTAVYTFSGERPVYGPVR